METSLKQRLLGAAVLVALAIIFVPMFISGPGPSQTSETANLQAPTSPERRLQERTLSLDLPPASQTPSAAPVDEPVAGEPDVDQRFPTVDTATAPRGVAEPVTDVPAAPVVAAPKPAPAVVPKPAANPPSAPTPTRPAAVSTTPAANSPASAPRTVQAPTSTAPDLPGTAANGTYFVHLGDYGNGKNAADLVATLKKAGYSAFGEASSFGGKATTRVRVGPFADRAAAEATRLRIGQARINAPASVVQNAGDVSAAKPAVAPAGRPAAWAVQLGAFATVDEANKLRDEVRAASFPAYVDKVVREGRTLWRVRVGPEAERSGAESTRDRLRARLKREGDVVSHP